MSRLRSVFGRNQQSDQLEQQQAGQDHARNLANGLEDLDVDAEYIDKLTQTELNDATVSMLANMLSRDWVLANMTDAEVNETRWLSRVMMLRVERLHPGPDSVWTGEFRKFCADNEQQALEPLTSAQRTEIFELIQGVIARATRSREGWQQDKLNESISVSERRDNSESDDGGLW